MMKKFVKTLLVLAALLLVLMPVASVKAQDTTKKYVIDDADLLTDDEEAQLNEYLKKKSDECKVDIVAVTSKSGYRASDFRKYLADILTDKYGYTGSAASPEAICYGIDISSRVDTLVTGGSTQKTLGQSKEDAIREAAEDIISGAEKSNHAAYYKAIKKYADKSADYLNRGLIHRLTRNMGIKLLISLVVTIIVVGAALYHTKVHMSVSDMTYAKDNSIHLTESRDDYINTTRVRRKKQSGGGGSSSGSGSFSGSSGGSFGSSSGNF